MSMPFASMSRIRASPSGSQRDGTMVSLTTSGGISMPSAFMPLIYIEVTVCHHPSGYHSSATK